jgi:putative ATP-binding cassette transporter
MRLINFIIATARRTFVLALLAGGLAGLSMVAVLAMTNQALHNPDIVSAQTIMVYFLLIGLVVVSRVTSTVLLTRLSQDSIANLRLQLSREIISAPLINLEAYGPHKLLASLSADISSISNGIMRLPFLIMNSAMLLGCLLYLLWLSWVLFLVAVIVMGIGTQAYRWPQTRALVFFKDAREKNDELYKGFRAVCEGTKELKMHKSRREAFFTGSFERTITSYADSMVGGRKYYSFAGNFGILLFFSVIGTLVLIVPKWIEIEQSALAGYVLILLFLQGPIETIMTAIPELAKTSVSLDKLQSLGIRLNPDAENEPLIRPVQELEEPIHFKQSIKLRNVTHKYYRELEGSHFQLGPINLDFKPGELVFLIGGNGSGKTTLAKLLLGLYEPDSGSITVDDKELSRDQYEEYRQLFSAVFVDFFLFDELLGLENIDLDAKASQYLEQLQLSHKVAVEGGKLSTTQLSQGQKKRLTLMSAYLEDRPFYVFDEWAADQDPEFKRVFYRSILPDLRDKGKTVLVISHDEQYFDVADRYIKMDSGQIMVHNIEPSEALVATS